MVNRKDFRPTDCSDSLKARDRKIIRELEKEKRDTKNSKLDHPNKTQRAYDKGYYDGTDHAEYLIEKNLKKSKSEKGPKKHHKSHRHHKSYSIF